jgi:pyruvate dehydrogenase E2 component (dihydrolipoamide acetyltransferase)
MADIIRMPKLSDTMTDGVVAEWHKKVGDKVLSGEVLAEIETDKATMEFESYQDGILLHIGVEKGKTAPVDSLLAIIGEAGEDITALLAGAVKTIDVKKETPPAQEKVVTPQPAMVEKTPTKPIPAPVEPTPIPQAVKSNTEARLKASPLAKSMAEERGININKLNGSGDGGRIIRRDIENYAGNTAVFSGIEKFSEEPVSQMRKIIATRLAESKFTAPHFYLTIEINMDNAIEARNSINTSIAPEKISFNDLVIKSVAASLKKHPKVNSSWLGDRIRYNEHIHIGVAVAVPDGLLVPVVRFANEKTLTQIGAEVREFAAKAKSKKLQPEDWQGNTFTISNLGMFGIDEFTAIINTPDACILAVGGISEKPVVKNGQIVVGNIMKVTLSCDHRVVDGAIGSAFLQTFKAYLQNPVLLLGEQSI